MEILGEWRLDQRFISISDESFHCPTIYSKNINPKLFLYILNMEPLIAETSHIMGSTSLFVRDPYKIRFVN